MRKMRKIALLVVSIFMTSCALSEQAFVFKMNKPVEQSFANFLDENIEVSFEVKETDIAFNFKNLSGKPISILWDKASVQNNGEVMKLIHRNVHYTDKENIFAATNVPANTFFNDLIQPISESLVNTRGFQRKAYFYWSKKPLFDTQLRRANFPFDRTPTTGYGKYMGWKIDIYLPLLIDGKQLDYNFEIEIADIVLKKDGKITKSLIKKGNNPNANKEYYWSKN